MIEPRVRVDVRCARVWACAKADMCAWLFVFAPVEEYYAVSSLPPSPPSPRPHLSSLLLLLFIHPRTCSAVHIHTHANADTHTRTHRHRHTHGQTHTHIQTHADTHTHTHLESRVISYLLGNSPREILNAYMTTDFSSLSFSSAGTSTSTLTHPPLPPPPHTHTLAYPLPPHTETQAHTPGEQSHLVSPRQEPKEDLERVHDDGLLLVVLLFRRHFV